MAEFTIPQLQRIAQAVSFTGATDPYLSIQERGDYVQLVQHINALVKERTETPVVEVGKTYQIEARHWANGKLVTVDRVANGQASFYTVEQPTGYGTLELDAFKPQRARAAVSLGHTYLLETEDPLQTPRVVVVQLPLDQSTAVVHIAGEPAELFCCLCSKLKAVV